jgi:hypothetical protein
MATMGEVASFVCLLRVDGEGGSRFGWGRRQPWERVACGYFGSKVKVSEWRIFGVEWLLGAANRKDRREERTSAFA